jgi:UDP-N-acetyl-2-amino-2-deoxyglucuronate dehydrogenase
MEFLYVRIVMLEGTLKKEDKMKFALIGAAGYIAPRHFRAIRDIGGELVAALDPHDSVGILDKYFPNAAFFTEFERFDRHLDKLRRKGEGVQFVSICSPNYLHDAHIRFAFRIGADAICEKPVVIKPHNIDALQELERETGHRAWVILQLRHHEVMKKLKAMVESDTKIHKVELTYLTPRGKWYHNSWKADQSKSGGLAMNIGVHFFDMLQWVFGPAEEFTVNAKTVETISGTATLNRADVHWHLSISQGEKRRSLIVDGDSIDFTEGFEDLHTEVYKHILAGNGNGLDDAKAAIRISNQITGSK